MHTRISPGNFFPLLAVPAVVALPTVGQWFFPYTTWILGALLFFSFLGLGLEDLMKVLKEPKEAFYVSLVVLVLTPLVIYPVMQRFFPEYFLGAFIFMLLPSAVSSPAVAALYAGNVARATVNTVVSNLLSPFTIVLFLAVFASAAVKINLMTMLYRLALIVILPFVLGLFVNRYLPTFVAQTRRAYRPINLFLLFLIFFAALSPYTESMTSNLFNGRLWLAVFVTHLVLYFFAKLAVLHEKVRADKIAIESNLFFLNIALGVVIAQHYFGPMEMLFIIFCEIVWLLLIPVFKYFQ